MRIAALNVWHRSHPWQERLRAIRHELASLHDSLPPVEGTVWPSDHFGLVADVSLARASR